MIKVIKEGYEIHSETKKIRFDKGEPEEWIIKLKPLTRPIHILSTPYGARVHLDNEYKCDTNCTLSEVVVGPHTITLKKSGYFDEPITVSISADGPPSLHVTLRRCGYINISSNPPGANVSLDGNYTGEITPANISNVARGNHTIKLRKLGYDNEERNVDVSVAKTYPVHVNLRGYGYINISSNPSGASVYLDGNDTEETTPTNISKVVGNYSIKLTKWDYEDVTESISVSAGRTTPVFEHLSLTLWGRKKPWIPLYVAIISLIAVVIFAFVELYKLYKK